MASLRFATLRDLYEAFPTGQDDIEEDANDAPLLAFLRALAASRSWDKAVALCAYMLPRREAVWWGCQSLRRMIHLAPQEMDILAVAEAWVRAPDEQRRLHALACGRQCDTQLPGTWMALAAGWSGGNTVPPGMGMVPPAPHQTARAVRAGLLIGMARIPREHVDAVMEACVNGGIQIAGGTSE